MHLSGHTHASHPAPTPAYACLLACAHTCLPVPVDKCFFFFLSACVHDCNLHAPTYASTPLPAPTHMHLSGHAHASCPVPTPAYACLLACDEVAADEVENREENSVGDEASCSLPKVYLYTLWSTCVHNPLRGD